MIAASDSGILDEEKVKQTIDLLDAIFNKLIELGQSLLGALIIGVIGWYIVKLMMRSVRKILTRSNLEQSVSGFLYSAIQMILKLILAVMVAARLGIEMTSIVALIGSAGLAIGLAFQGSLSNFAGGVLILILKPFLVGDYIIDGNKNEGTVTAIDIFYTKVLTPDNRTLVIPNGALANSTIINTSKEETRRIDFNVGVGYSEDIDRVKEVLTDIAVTSPYTIKDQDIRVILNSFDPSAITMTLRLWVNSSDLLTAKSEIQEMIKKAFDKLNISIPFERLDVKLLEPEKSKSDD